MMYIWAWQAAALQPARWISSSTALAAEMPRPAPPYSSGIRIESQPAAVSALTNSVVGRIAAFAVELAPVGAVELQAELADGVANLGMCRGVGVFHGGAT
jgi:hypothetical protein